MIRTSIPKEAIKSIAGTLYGHQVAKALEILDATTGVMDAAEARDAIQAILETQEPIAEAAQGRGDSYIAISLAADGFHVDLKSWKAAKSRLLRTHAELEPLATCH